MPGIVWLVVLFLLPFWAVLAVAFGYNNVYQEAVPAWWPWQWNSMSFITIYHQLFGPGAFLGPPFIRTFIYVGVASLACLLIAYPVAYYVARYGGKRKGLYLTLLIAPFCVSYMMRMLAWVNLLESDGWVNRVIGFFHIFSAPVNWLDGNPVTVVFGLVYGYIPYMVLPLYAFMDRIDPSLLEASRDLGAGRARTFLLVTLRLSRQAILAGLVIVTLPMFGDYFTNDLLSGSPRTSMIGNLIDDSIGTPGQEQIAAALICVLMIILVIPVIYYIWSTNRASRELAG